MAGARGAAQQTFLVVRAVTARDYSQADLLWLFRFLLLLLFLAIQILYTNLFLFFFLVHFSFCFCLVCAAFLAQQVQGNYIFLLNECSLVGFEADVGDWGRRYKGGSHSSVHRNYTDLKRTAKNLKRSTDRVVSILFGYKAYDVCSSYGV